MQENSKTVSREILLTEKTLKPALVQKNMQETVSLCICLLTVTSMELKTYLKNKNKTSNSTTEASNVKRIEKRVVLQTLLQRLSQLEHSLIECNKELKPLHVELNNLKTDYSRLNAEATSRFS